MTGTGDFRCTRCHALPAPAATGLCVRCGGRQGRQPDGTYRMVCYDPPTPPLFGRRSRREQDREAEAGQ
jgi:hypothetical protein